MIALLEKQKSARGLTYFASIGMAQQKMFSPQKWLHLIVMLGAKLRSTCVKEKSHKIKGSVNSFTTQLCPHQHFCHKESHLKFMTFGTESVQRHRQLRLCGVCIHVSRNQCYILQVLPFSYNRVSF